MSCRQELTDSQTLEKATLRQCARYIELLRRTIGPEPEGAQLGIKWFDHDFGAYCEVVCYFNIEHKTAVAYAQRCEDDAPVTWEA